MKAEAIIIQLVNRRRRGEPTVGCIGLSWAKVVQTRTKKIERIVRVEVVAIANNCRCGDLSEPATGLGIKLHQQAGVRQHARGHAGGLLGGLAGSDPVAHAAAHRVDGGVLLMDAVRLFQRLANGHVAHAGVVVAAVVMSLAGSATRMAVRQATVRAFKRRIRTHDGKHCRRRQKREG